MKYVENLNTHINRINPSIKLLYLFLYIIINILPNCYEYIRIGSFIIVVYLMITAKVPLKKYLEDLYKCLVIIIAMFIIFASFNYTFNMSLLYVLSFVFGVCLYNLIAYTTSSFELAVGIYNFLKYFNFLSLNNDCLFIKIYNLVTFRIDYRLCQNNVIESLELKGKSIKDKNILSRFLIKLDLVNIVMLKLKEKRKKREKMMLRNNLSVKNFDQNIHLIDIIYMSAFVLLLCIHISKVI